MKIAIATAAADKSIKDLSERLNNLYPDLDKDNEGITHWKGKPIIPAEDWKRIAITGIKGSLLKEPFLGFAPIGIQYFPDDLVELALGFEGSSVYPYAEDIFPHHESDSRPGTDGFKQLLGPESLLSEAELKLWETRLKEKKAQAERENPLEIWIQEYKELLKYKNIRLPEYDDTHIV